MKELNPTSWIYWFGIVTIACMLFPVIVILVKNQFSLGYIALATYFLSTFTYNLLLIVFPDFPKEMRQNIGITNNILDTPLMLIFLSQFTFNPGIKKLIRNALIAFLVFEFCIVLLYGFSVKALSIFSGPGLLMILSFSFYFFTRYVRMTIAQRVDIPKTMMISGILFAYAVYFMVYLFYYVLETPHKTDALIIYFLASIVASVLISAGLIREKNVVRKESGLESNTKYKVGSTKTVPTILGRSQN